MPDVFDQPRLAEPSAAGGFRDPAPAALERFGAAPRAGATPAQGPVYGAIDLGTNNCRLLIARPARHGFRVVDAFSRIVRLGEGLMETGRLSEAAQDRAIEALAICADKLARRGVRLTRHVATEACRQAENCTAFVARVYEATGLHLDVISAAEEARLAVLGCQALFDRSRPYALVFDIGGGSTEIILARLHRHGCAIEAWVSVPWGVVSLAEAHAATPLDAEVYERMKALVRGHLEPFGASPAVRAAVAGGGCQMIGTSGTVTTLASLHLRLPAYDRRQVDGCVVDAAAMHAISARLARMTHDERVLEPCIGTERADLVVPGCAVLEAILDSWPFERLTVADRGIREGVLRTLMMRDGHG